MDKIVVLFLMLPLIFILWLVFSNKRIKRIHRDKMKQLKDLFSGLVKKQEVLNQKASISSEFQLKYKSDMSKLSEEIFVLQKKILELLTKK
ncbi:MAG: hypothetical protein KA215_09225 [Flavobacterium sp.]|nr:hypothetical protein [Flavobacterium sp.]